MWEGSRCPCKCGRGPSFSHPSNIPFSYRQLNRSYNQFDKIKIVHFCFFISSSTLLRDTYLRNILSFHPDCTQRDIQTLHTEMRSIKTVPARSTLPPPPTGGLRPEVQVLTLLYTILTETSTLSYTFDWQWYSLYLHSLWLCISLNFYKCTAF